MNIYGCTIRTPCGQKYCSGHCSTPSFDTVERFVKNAHLFDESTMTSFERQLVEKIKTFKELTR